MAKTQKCELESVERFKGMFEDRKGELIEFSKNGGRIFCYNCLLPKVVIHAGGGQVVKLLGMMNLYGTEGTVVDEYLPHGSEEFCTLIKYTFGTGIKKPHPEGMKVTDTATCSALTKLMSMMYMAMPEFGMPHIVNIPRRAERKEDQDFWYEEIERLKDFVEKHTGNKVTDEALRKCIKDENHKKELMKELAFLRKGPTIPIRGSECVMVNQQQNWLESEKYITALEEVVKEARERKEKGISVYAEDAPRVLVTDPCFFEPFRETVEPNRAVRLIEDCGAAVVAEDFCSGVGEYWHPIPENGRRPLETIADYYLNVVVPCPFQTPNTRRLDRCIEAVKELDIKGVVYMSVSACKVAAAEARKFESAMAEHGISTLYIERIGDPDNEPIEQLRIRLESFVEMLKNK